MNEMDYQNQQTESTQAGPMMGSQPSEQPMEAQDSQRQQGEPMPQNVKIDDKAIAKMAGEAISQVDGVLGVQGGLTDMLKRNDDKTTGIAVSLSSQNVANVSVKLITEFGKNIPQIVDEVTSKISESLMNMAGITTEKVEVEITDTMTRDEYEQKNNMNSRPMH